MKSISQRIVRLFFPEGEIRSVLFGPIRGMRFRVCPKCSMGATFALGNDAFNQRWFARQIRQGMTIYDIGANSGQMALHFSKFVGPLGKVIAFEPVPINFDNLTFNIRLNSLKNVETHCVAIGSHRGEVSFAFNEQSPTTGKIFSCEPSNNDMKRQISQVKMLPLDEFLREGGPAPDIIKIDVEGGAGLVLQGAAHVLERCRPKVYVELHGPEEQEAIKRCLLEIGYHAAALTGEPVRDPAFGGHGALWCFPGPGLVDPARPSSLAR